MSKADPQSTSSPVLSVGNLRKVYGNGKVAVENVSFEVRQNEIVGLLGPNGAGKTTTINMVLGVLEPSSGQVEIENINITRNRTKAMQLINFAAVYAPLPGNMTVYQNLRVFGMLYGIKNLDGRIETLMDKYNLRIYRDTKCGVLSSGEQTRVALAKAMLNEPKLLVLDEPTASLDPSIARDIRHSIKEFASQGTGGVLWTSHNMYEVEEVCDRVLFLSQGKILLEGNPRTLPAENGYKTLEDLFVGVAHESLSEPQEKAA